MNKKILSIDTTDYGSIEFSLTGQSETQKRSYKITPQESDKILDYLEIFFKAEKISHPELEIKKIYIYKGPGSFTGLRIGAAIAQALSLAWRIPLQVLKK